jgi:peptide subunit release factor 1 (eRF1)
MLSAPVPVDAPSLRDRLAELARRAGGPVVSVYLDTRWRDEHQRDRVRAFLRHELKRARRATRDATLLEDLAWTETEAELVIRQSRAPEAHGVAIFASTPLALREVLEVGLPFDEGFFVADRPVLAPLMELVDEAPSTLVVFVDGVSARLIPLDASGRGEEVALEHAVERRHRRGGWALLAQSRYQRQIEHQRAQHFEAVAAAVTALVHEQATERIVLAGESRAVALFRDHLSGSIAARVAGTIHGDRHEPAAELADRARSLLAELARVDAARAVDALLTEAAKGGRAVAGVQPTLDAVARGAVHRLYLSKDLTGMARECPRCGALSADAERCTVCGVPSRDVRLGEALVERVLGSGGDVELVIGHVALERIGGVAARLRWPM